MVFQFRENRVRRAYTGGSRIDRFTGGSGAGDSRPEEWLASSVSAFNPDYSFFVAANSGTLSLEGQAEVILCTA